MSQSVQKQTFRIVGMSCDHCRSAVEEAIRTTAGVAKASVDLKAGQASVEGQFDPESVVVAVEEAGYEAMALTNP